MTAITIRDVTVKERILLHLSRFTNVAPGQEFNVPFDLTQDGIAMVVGITRSHASLDLKKLGESGMVTYWQARQKGVRTKRLVYSITQTGMLKADETRTKLESGGIDVDVILDMKKCDPETKWNALSPQDREVFGKICVLRVPVPRDEFPPTPTGTLPTDVYGMTSVPPEVAKAYLSKVSDDDVRKWNSWAADWWMDRDNPQERLYHLVNAGRMLEACKLAKRCGGEFMNNPNEDLVKTLNIMTVPDSMSEDILWLKSQIAVSCLNIEEAKKCAKELSRMQSALCTTVKAQISLLKGDYREAYEMANLAYQSMHTPAAAIIMSRSCAKSGDLKEADQLALEACDAMHRIGDARDIDEILRVRAEIAYRSGDRDSALALLGKAKIAAPDFKKSRIQDLIDLMSSPDSRVVFD